MGTILKKLLILFIGIIFFFSANTQTKFKKGDYNSPAYALINKAFKIKDTNLDSAFIYWEKANKLQETYTTKIEKAYLLQVGSNLLRLRNESQKAFKMAKESLTIYEELNDQFGVSMVNIEIGLNYLERFILDSAEVSFNRSLEIKKNMEDDDEGLGVVFSNLGTICDYKGEYIKASEYYLKSIDFSTLAGDKLTISNNYHNLSIIQYNSKEINKAIESQQKAISLNKEIKNLFGESMNHVCLSEYFLEINNTEKAKMHAFISYEICKSLKYERGTIFALSALGTVFLKLQNFFEANKYFDQCLKLLSKAEDPYMMSQVKYKKGQAYLLQKQYNMAKKLFIEALYVYKKNGTIKELADVHLSLAQCYKNKNDSKKALSHLELSNVYRDSLFKDEKYKEIVTLESRFNTQKKELENQKLILEQKFNQETIENQSKKILAGSIIFIIILGLLFTVYRLWQKQKQLTQIAIQNQEMVKMLNKELNHRVKNNLAFMSSLLEMQANRTQNEEAKNLLLISDTRIKSLSLIHSHLEATESDSTINTKPYLIELICMLEELYLPLKNSLKIETNFINYNLNAEDAMKIGLCVNELITNSLKHAFSISQNSCLIYITTSVQDNKLKLTYSDNGTFKVNETTNNQTLGLKLITLLIDQLKEKCMIIVEKNK